jgi:hypothetical protein
MALPNVACRKGWGKKCGAEGYRAAILLESEMGESVYRRLGFREYCKIGEYSWVDKAEP